MLNIHKNFDIYNKTPEALWPQWVDNLDIDGDGIKWKYDSDDFDPNKGVLVSVSYTQIPEVYPKYWTKFDFVGVENDPTLQLIQPNDQPIALTASNLDEKYMTIAIDKNGYHLSPDWKHNCASYTLENIFHLDLPNNEGIITTNNIQEMKDLFLGVDDRPGLGTKITLHSNIDSNQDHKLDSAEVQNLRDNTLLSENLMNQLNHSDVAFLVIEDKQGNIVDYHVSYINTNPETGKSEFEQKISVDGPVAFRTFDQMFDFYKNQNLNILEINFIHPTAVLVNQDN